MQKFKNLFSLFSRAFGEGSLQLWRNKFLSFSTIILATLIILLLNFVLAIKIFANFSLEQLEARANYSIPLQENYDVFEYDALKNELKSFPITIKYLPSETQNNILIPNRLHISFQDLQVIPKVFEIIKKVRYIDVVDKWDNESQEDFEKIVSRILTIRETVILVTRIIIIVFLISGAGLILNTFRMVIFSRKNEIFIARLVGAMPNFIIFPYIVEGVLLGLFSSFISIFIFILILTKIKILPGGVIFLEMWNNYFIWEILCSAIIGGLGAWITVRNYLFGKFQKD